MIHGVLSPRTGAAVPAGEGISRVLGATAVADSLESAIKTAYEMVGKISFDNQYYRNDIGRKAMEAKEQA